MRSLWFKISFFICLLTPSLSFAGETINIGPYEIGTFDPGAYSQTPTQCDLLAGNPDDPYRVSAGKFRSEMLDLPAAVSACRDAVKADLKNPRLNYQLGRSLGYSERGAEANQYRKVAVDAGYPQSLFVIGYIHLTGSNIDKDICLGAELIRLSALAGRFAGQTSFPHYVTSGQFDECPVYKDKQEMLAILKAAEGNARNYYERMLVDSLKLLVAQYN